MSKSRNKKDYGKFKSHFELEVAEVIGDDKYEVSEVDYEEPAVSHKYTPDFSVTATDGHTVHFETKGRFRTKSEADKYIWVRDSNPDIDLRFIIMDKKTLMPRSKKTTMYDWLKKNGFVVYVWPNVPKKCIFAKK